MHDRPELAKAPTGITGLDEITEGGLPLGRTTLVCGAAGSGKSLLGAEFLVRGVLDHGDPGVLLSFEESPERIGENVRSFGWDLEQLVAQGMLVIDEVELEEPGAAPNLDGLFLRLAAAIDAVQARRVVIDGIDTLFSSSDLASRRAQLRQLFDWLGTHGLTAVVTAGRGREALTATGLEEYVADCVILLDARVVNRGLTRHLRVVKYRGSHHGPNECPFIIDRNGFEVLPVSSVRLDHPALDERISTGSLDLDGMLGGGILRGTSVLVTGPPGSAKSTLSSVVAAASCARGERALVFAFEESPDPIVRNMRSVGIDLQRWRDEGLLRIVSTRPTEHGLESHLARMRDEVTSFEPQFVVLDPVTALGEEEQLTEQMLGRLMDFLRGRGVTVLMTGLTREGGTTGFRVSSAVDTWLLVSNPELGGERNRGISVRKSRGSAHSNQLREFVLNETGLHIAPPYAGAAVLMGSARAEREESDRAEGVRRSAQEEAAGRHRRRRALALEAQIAVLQAELESEAGDLDRETVATERRDEREAEQRVAAVAARGGSSDAPGRRSER